MEISLASAYYIAMLQKEHTSGSAHYYGRLVKKIDRYMIENDISTYSIQVGLAFYDWWTSECDPSGELRTRLFVIIHRLDEMLSGRDISFSMPRVIPPDIPKDIKDTINAFQEYQMHTLGIGIETAKNYTRSIQQFFVISGIQSVSEISLASIEQGFLCATNKRVYKTAMRKYTEFLYLQHKISDNYAEVLPNVLPKIPNSHPLPSVYTDTEISALLNVIDRSTLKGCRDFAIIMLAARMGLRASDICNLTLSEISFETSELQIVQKKTGIPLKLPLLPEVRGALYDYIQWRDIKTQSEPIFVRCNAPYKQLTHMGLWAIMRRYLNDACIDTGRRKRGTHALRSSLASQMVNESVPYYVVQKILGHESPQATQQYIRIDINSLTAVTLPVPEASGKFASFLMGGDLS